MLDKKMAAILFAALALLLLAGCTKPAATMNARQETEEAADNNAAFTPKVVVEAGDSVRVDYVGRFPESREVFDRSEGRGPLEFTAGAGQMIEGFDKAVLGMAVGEEKTIIIPPEAAYGKADDATPLQIPLEQIGVEGLQVGAVLLTSAGQQGTVTGIKDGVATVSFVHPLAGKTLEFWIKVVEIKKGLT